MKESECDRLSDVGNQEFDLMTVLHNALEGAATCDLYIQDAAEAGDEELTDFFRDLQAEECQRAARAKALLEKRIDPTSNEPSNRNLVETKGADQPFAATLRDTHPLFRY